MRHTVVATVSVLVATLAALGAGVPASGSSSPTFTHRSAASPTFTRPSRADARRISRGDPKHVNEPATWAAPGGARYVAYQRGSQLSVTRDGGRTWRHLHGAEMLTRHIRSSSCTSQRDVGDVELAGDQRGRLYFADLQVTANSGSGGADSGIQPVVAYSSSHQGFRRYHGVCAAHQPASVDREWMAAWRKPHRSSRHASVYLSYHDFSVNTIWVNASHDGGRHWGQPVNVINDPQASDASACDTIPAGTAVDPRNGWVYVAWTAGSNSLSNAATGCNYTQGAVFNQFWVAVSKDGGRTWTDSLAFSGPDVTAAEPSDMSEIFGSLAVGRDGTVYVSFPAYLHHEYDGFVTWAPPAGPDGTLRFHRDPVKVNGPGTHTTYFTRLVAGDHGRVDVIYLGSHTRNVVSTPTNKATYDGSDPTKPNCVPDAADPGGKGVRFLGKPCEMPASSTWGLFLAQSLHLTATRPGFTRTTLRRRVHTGDICTLGIFCLGDDNRDIADVNDIKIDSSGGAQVAYTWESAKGTRTEIDFQCQRGGSGVYRHRRVRDCRG